jgi:6-phosphogluconate dehydrogenase
MPTIAAALDARMMSGMKGERLPASTLLASGTTGRVTSDARERFAAIHDALRGAMVCAYVQGMSLLRTASGEYGWGVELREIARIWKGGCIICAWRSRARELPSLLCQGGVGCANAGRAGRRPAVTENGCYVRYALTR